MLYEFLLLARKRFCKYTYEFNTKPKVVESKVGWFWWYVSTDTSSPKTKNSV
jgi:hypothetical protein